MRMRPPFFSVVDKTQTKTFQNVGRQTRCAVVIDGWGFIFSEFDEIASPIVHDFA